MIFDWFWFAVLVYLALATFTYFRNMQYPSMGRVLALMRAVLWPLWWATGRPGKPEGQRYG